MKNENFETCRRIAEELDNIASAGMYRCPECGEIIPYDETCFDGETREYTCQECGAAVDVDALEPFGMFDYFENALDIEYYSRGRGADDYNGARIMIACGGPDIFVDTRRGCVELFWWNEYARCDLWGETRDAIDEIFSEIWAC